MSVKHRMDFLIGGVAAVGATLIGNPLDVLKTRMQLQGELKPKGQHAVHYRNIVHAMKLIAKNEGIWALQKGLSAALLVHGLRNSIKLGTYQYLTKKGYICDNQNHAILYKSLMASAFSGGLAAFIGTPFFKVTTQLQSKAAGEIAVGYQHNHNGVRSALRNIYSQYGIRGLWRNASAIVVRSMVGASAQLTTFSYSKAYLAKTHEIFQYSDVMTASFASFFSAIMLLIFQTPFDVVCTRLNNQYYDPNGKGLLYNGMIDCFHKTLKLEGFVGLYKGVTANYIKISRQTSFLLVFWEILKNYGGIYLGYPENKPCYYESEEISIPPP